LDWDSIMRVSILAAYAAGLISFLSPCVLPVLPGIPVITASVLYSRN
jgi:cytochrome c biogenesis protein CcdA